MRLAALKRNYGTAFLVLALLLAQFTGLQHRIEHARWQGDPFFGNLYEPDGGKKGTLHSCVALDGATLADCIGAAPAVLALPEDSFAHAPQTVPPSWMAPPARHFPARAPPRA